MFFCIRFCDILFSPPPPVGQAIGGFITSHYKYEKTFGSVGELYEIFHLNLENYASLCPNLITTKTVLYCADLMA